MMSLRVEEKVKTAKMFSICKHITCRKRHTNAKHADIIEQSRNGLVPHKNYYVKYVSLSTGYSQVG